jgi:phage terminase Nu1 subunit (DNA packaging protein)
VPGRLATRQEAVKALGLASPRALDRLIERGAPGPRPGKPGGRRYDVAAIAAWRDARAARQRPTLDLALERAKLAQVQRALASLKLREARGELIRAKDAADVLRGIVAAARAQLLSVPRRAVLAGLPREHEPAIRRLIVEALRELSEARTLAELARPANTDEDAA